MVNWCLSERHCRDGACSIPTVALPAKHRFGILLDKTDEHIHEIIKKQIFQWPDHLGIIPGRKNASIGMNCPPVLMTLPRIGGNIGRNFVYLFLNFPFTND